MTHIEKKLEKYLLNSDCQKSSHWKLNLKDADFKNIEENFGFGEYYKKNITYNKRYIELNYENFISKLK